jgi:hypothetical protein
LWKTAPRCAGLAAGHLDIAAGEGRRHHEGAGFDAVRNDPGLHRPKFGHALDGDLGCSGPLNVGSHGPQGFGQGHDFGLARGIAQNGPALGQNRRHEQVFGAGDGGDIEVDLVAPEHFGRSLDITVLEFDVGPQKRQALEMQIDGPRPDGAAAGKRHPSPFETRHQRAQHQDRGPHFAHQLVGSLGAAEASGIDAHAAAVAFHRCTQLGQKFLDALDVFQIRYIVVGVPAVGQQRGSQNGQGGVLGPVDLHPAPQGAPAFDDDFIHDRSLCRRRKTDMSLLGPALIFC